MKMIVFSGLPGTGKSLLAESIAKHFGIPVFAKDWLEASMVRSGLTFTGMENRLGIAGYDLLTTLAERQLMLNQSVILDSVASTETIRNTWRQLSIQFEADWRVIECLCSDETLHRSRLQLRERKIPGWHELTWSDVQNVRRYYATWTEERLILDMIHPFDDNYAKARAYCE
ncbi:MAG TPA: AAA family ATPase [Anaerolineales bacterium]|nr:AAA family ATPase [Anaerolineales bacterium]